MTEPAPEPQDPDGLVIPTSLLAKRAKLDATDPAVHEVLVEAIQDAQADVVGYLGRAIVPTEYEETGVGSTWTGEWDLAPLDEPVLEVLSATPELAADGVTPTGYYTVVYRAGIDAADTTDASLHPIRRYVRAHALNSPEVTKLWQSTGGKGEVRSVSAEGQSISYGPATLGGGGEAGSGVPGALPKLSSLDFWRVAGRRAYHRKDSYAGTWPHVSLDPDGMVPWRS
jgi:hypothetical protein